MLSVPLYRIHEACSHISHFIIREHCNQAQVMSRVLLGLHCEPVDKWSVNMHGIMSLNQSNIDALLIVIYYMYKHNLRPVDVFGSQFISYVMALQS
jgi:hypothetical protein